MIFYNLIETAERVGISRPSIYRYYQKNPECWHETKIGLKRRLIPEAHLKLLCKKNIYTRASVVEEENINLKRLIDTLAMGCHSIQYKCFQWHWDWSGSIDFGDEVTDTYKVYQMRQLFDHLVGLYGKGNNLKIFFSLNPTTMFNGSLYFNLGVSHHFNERVINDCKNFLNSCNVEFRTYNKFKSQVYHLSSKGERGEDWDIYVNNSAFSKSIQ